MKEDCKHKWGLVLVQHRGKILPSAARMCVKCGLLKIGAHTIKLSKDRLDMDGKPIDNAGKITATELHGVVYYSDVHFEETTCPICGKKFRKNDKITLLTRKVDKKGISLWPVHLDCSKRR